MAKLIAAAGDRGTPLAFCIGGPFGHSDAMHARASESVRLSRMVLNHQVWRCGAGEADALIRLARHRGSPDRQETRRHVRDSTPAGCGNLHESGRELCAGVPKPCVSSGS
mmetsp:Transcript_41180/g.122967  ORF Transcript_41180/g.122967 Transcript_41180/m.122967 type:complete len:110 (-) Transcript_41180:229-558(-)